MAVDQIIQICEAILQKRKTDHISPIGCRIPWSAFLWLFMFFIPSACQTPQFKSNHVLAPNIVAPVTVQAGHFLSARQATYLNDVSAAADFYLAALQPGEQNVRLLQQGFVTQYRNGNIDTAAALARQLETMNINTPSNVEPAIAQAITTADWDAVIVLSDQLAEDITTMPLAGVIKSWALVAIGQGDAGLAHLAESGKILAHSNKGLPTFVQIQLALMTEFLGYQYEASEIATRLARSQTLPAKLAFQTAGILARGGESQMANALLDKLPDGFDHSQVNPVQIAPPNTPAEFIANAIIDAALAYRDPQFINMVPARLQLALYLDPKQETARFFLARSWFEMGQFDRAKSTLKKIKAPGVWALPRQLLLNDIDFQDGNKDKAIERFQAYVIGQPKDGYLLKELGDLYRRDKQYVKARDSYLQAVKTGFDTANLHRNLAISHERLNEDKQAERHFKGALARDPDDPFTLNYLGYWWAESGRHLTQAINLIEQAVRLRPNSGHFVDSLGWVHYQLGNYQLAVEFLEKATILEPEDAVIIAHLGDAYWRTNRYNEAQYKWRYAAKITEDTALQADLQNKLVSGLPIIER
ncbi:MAG: tetratricopeptide repeat protein [Pseudomonadota bacterium]|nr:tetratricopeptide repeat protein [Pseudomonadota bacterium]